MHRTDWLPDVDLFPEALAQAASRDHPVHDCVYLIAARRFDATLLTADRRLQKIAV